MANDPPHELSSEQKALIIDYWNNQAQEEPTIQVLCKVAYGYPYHVTTKHGKAVRDFLVERGLKARSHKDKVTVTIPPNQKDFILENAHRMSVLELARLIYQKEKLSPNSQEVVVLKEYISKHSNEINNIDVHGDKCDKFAGSYKPPKTVSQAVTVIARYCKVKYRKETLSAHQLKHVESLIHFMNTANFRITVESLTTENEKELFESSFVRYVYDKDDLTEEDADIYIGLCLDYVEELRLQQEISHLSRLLEESSSEDENGKGIRISLVESLEASRQSLDRNRKRKQNALSALQQKRSDRLKNYQASTVAVTNLTAAWRDEEKRKSLINLVEKDKKQNLGNCITNLSSMDDAIASLYGMSPEEFLHGNH